MLIAWFIAAITLGLAYLTRRAIAAIEYEVRCTDDGGDLYVAIQSDLLANPSDPKDVGVRDPSVQGETEKFALRFRKPR